eukprot:236332_1
MANLPQDRQDPNISWTLSEGAPHCFSEGEASIIPPHLEQNIAESPPPHLQQHHIKQHAMDESSNSHYPDAYNHHLFQKHRDEQKYYENKANISTTSSNYPQTVYNPQINNGDRYNDIISKASSNTKYNPQNDEQDEKYNENEDNKYNEAIEDDAASNDSTHTYSNLGVKKKRSLLQIY